MKKEFIVNRQGKDFVLYAGLLDQAHREGLKRISTTLLQAPSDDNGHLAICSAEVETEKGVFSGIGDASPENVGRMIAMHTVRMAECVPLQARILTREGWRYHDEVQVGESVLAYDVAQDRCVWTPLLAVSVFPETPTMRMRSRSFDITCTPAHTWAVAQQNSPTRLVQAQALRSLHTIVVAALAEGGDNPLTPREAALLGWLATDGNIRDAMVGNWGPYKRATISQSKPAYLQELRDLVGADGSVQVYQPRPRTFAAGYTSECLPAYKFELTAGFARDLLAKAGFTTWTDLPRIVTRLSIDARAAMLDALLKGDGTSRNGRRWVFGQKAKPGVTEAFTILAALQGIALGAPRQSTIGEVPVWSLRENRVIAANYLKVEEGQTQPVWCPTTAYGTWVMDLHGCMSITGNTRAKARALRDAINVGVTALEELGDVEEDSSMPGRWSSQVATAARPRQMAAVPRPTATAEEAAPIRAAQGEGKQGAVPEEALTPATEQQIARLHKLQAALGRPAMVSSNLTSEEAAAQIGELVRIFNAQSRGTGRAQAR